MKLQAVSVAHFSPTGSTARIANHLGKALAGQVAEFDLSGQTQETCSFAQDAFTVVAVPVYAGRVPARAVEALRLCSGNGAACVSLAVCGGRAVDDALLELNDILAEQGFKVVASGAFVAQHSMVEEIAANRPDQEDLAALDRFATALLMASASGRLSGPPAVPGNRPYVAVQPTPIVPVTADSCTVCGQCAKECPVSAIPEDNFRVTTQGQCILCMRCIRNCPAGARALPPPFRAAVLERMRQKCPPRLEPQTYL